MKNFKPSVKNFLMWIAAPFIIAIFAATTIFQAGQAAPLGDDMPEPNAVSFWKYITSTNNYQNWQSWPGMQGLYEGQSPHGDYLKLFVNKPAYDALIEGKHLPVNSIIVKENYNEQKKLVAITPMYKVDGYNPEAGNWFWAKYGVDGEIMKSGKIAGCIDCHNKVKANDYLFSVE